MPGFRSAGLVAGVAALPATATQRRDKNSLVSVSNKGFRFSSFPSLGLVSTRSRFSSFCPKKSPVVLLQQHEDQQNKNPGVYSTPPPTAANQPLRKYSLKKVSPTEKEKLAQTDKDGWPGLFWHVELGEDEQALECLEKMPELLHRRDVRGLTVLHVAAWRGRREFIKSVVEEVMVEAGEVLELTKPEVRGVAALLPELVLEGINKNNQSNEGGTTEQVGAVVETKTSAGDKGAGVGEDSTKSGAPQKNSGREEHHPLGDLDNQLISSSFEKPPSSDGGGAGPPFDPLHVRTFWAETPLHHAVCQRQVETVRLLLELGADPDARDKMGRSPRRLARTMRGSSPDALTCYKLIEDAGPERAMTSEETVADVEKRRFEEWVAQELEPQVGYAGKGKDLGS